MNDDIPKIPSSEWEIMESIWKQPGLTGTEIHQRIGDIHGWQLNTINTFLSRLVKRGFLKSERDGRAFRFWPVVERKACVTQESDNFMKRIFRGQWSPLLNYFTENADLSDQELDELESILKQKKKGRTQ